MYFKEFLTEVRTGDILAFNKAAKAGQFDGPAHEKYYDVITFFEQRGYDEIGSGAFATALQATDHFIVKIAQGDPGYDSYAKISRTGRRNPHTPKIIAQKNVADNDNVRVYFIERLFKFNSVTAEQFIEHHTKKDAPVFLYLAGQFMDIHDSAEAKTAITVAETLDPSLQQTVIPKHPGYEDDKKAHQYFVNLNAIQSDLKETGEKLGGNHPFFQVLAEMKAIGREHYDMHSGNVMVREPLMEIVITDPLA